MRKKYLRFLLFASLSLSILLSACSEIFDIYKNPEFDSYNIHRIALLPMMWDDTTEDGTFYSTNHFINKIYDERDDVDLADIDSLRNLDYSPVLKMFKSIGNEKQINLDSIYASPIGNFLSEDGCDAIMVGTIDTVWFHTWISSSDNKLWASTHCIFNYYLFSLIDGELLWKTRINMSSNQYVSSDDLYFPPLDAAISAGIDYFFYKFPFEKKARLHRPL